MQSSLQDLGKNRKQNVLRFRKLYPDTDSETIEAALDMIAELNPYPAYGFASATPTPYIQPDVWVKEGEDGWEVISNEVAWPKLQLNQEYCDLMKSAEEGSPEWKEKINEAKQRIDSLELRKSHRSSALARVYPSKIRRFFHLRRNRPVAHADERCRRRIGFGGKHHFARRQPKIFVLPARPVCVTLFLHTGSQCRR